MPRRADRLRRRRGHEGGSVSDRQTSDEGARKNTPSDYRVIEEPIFLAPEPQRGAHPDAAARQARARATPRQGRPAARPRAPPAGRHRARARGRPGRPGAQAGAHAPGSRSSSTCSCWPPTSRSRCWPSKPSTAPSRWPSGRCGRWPTRDVGRAAGGGPKERPPSESHPLPSARRPAVGRRWPVDVIVAFSTPARSHPHHRSRPL